MSEQDVSRFPKLLGMKYGDGTKAAAFSAAVGNGWNSTISSLLSKVVRARHGTSNFSARNAIERRPLMSEATY